MHCLITPKLPGPYWNWSGAITGEKKFRDGAKRETFSGKTLYIYTIHSFHKCSLNSYYVPGAVAEDAALRITDKKPFP